MRHRPSAATAAVRSGALGLVLLLSGAVHAAGSEKFVTRFTLRDGVTCVVAEGDLEPRSIGTYSVRVYRNLEVGAYVAGVIQPRAGFVRRAHAAGPDGGRQDEIVVEIETAGSGRYVTTDVFTFDGSTLMLRREK